MVGGSHTFMVSLGGMLMWELVMLLEVQDMCFGLRLFYFLLI
ncbi:hypothetical protein HPSSW114_0142 [Glaesserella parasuis SW114]|nr:hypothetical protein HPSSW114_0142 [Glaesserella parasuis SW114]